MLGEDLDEGIRLLIRNHKVQPNLSVAALPYGKAWKPRSMSAPWAGSPNRRESPGPHSRSILHRAIDQVSGSVPASLSGLIMAVISFMPFHLPLQSLLSCSGAVNTPGRYILTCCACGGTCGCPSLPTSSATPVIATTTHARPQCRSRDVLHFRAPSPASGTICSRPRYEHLPSIAGIHVCAQCRFSVPRWTRAEVGSAGTWVPSVPRVPLGHLGSARTGTAAGTGAGA